LYVALYAKVIFFLLINACKGYFFIASMGFSVSADYFISRVLFRFTYLFPLELPLISYLKCSKCI